MAPRVRLALGIVLSLAAIAACGPSHGGGGDDDDTGTIDAPINTYIDAPDVGENAAVYAHTSGTLYRVHPLSYAITRVGDFVWPNGSDSMTDIAIDKDGVMIGISYTRVYRVDPATAVC